MQKIMWFSCGMLVGLTALSISKAALPTRGNISDDTAIHQRLSELHVPKQARLDFDSDINKLSSLESRYQEKLPAIAHNPRLKGPMQRVSRQKYQFSGKTTSAK